MVEETVLAAFFGGLILFGYLGYFLAQKFKVSHITILILIGTLLGLSLESANRFPSLDKILLYGIAFLYLLVLTFDSASKPSIRHVDTTHTHSLKLFILNTIMHFFLLTYILVLTLKLQIFEAAIFSLILTSTTSTFFFTKQSKFTEILKNEKIIGLPILLMVAYALYDNYSISYGASSVFSSPIKPYILELIGGIGVGILMGIVFFKTVRAFHKNKASPVIVFSVAFSSYLLTELLGCDGVAGLAAFALFYGNLHLEEKQKTLKFFEESLMPLELMIITLTAIILSIRLRLDLALYAFVLFLIIISLRYIAVKLTFNKHEHTVKEDIYLTLNSQIGSPLIIILLLIMITDIKNLETAAIVTLFVIFYSSISSTIMQRIEENN